MNQSKIKYNQNSRDDEEREGEGEGGGGGDNDTLERVEEDIKELLCYILACTEIALACCNTIELSDFLHVLFTHSTMCHVKSALDEITIEQYEGI